MELNGKRAVITGASSGIGFEVLKGLLNAGCTVAACARHIEKIGLKSDRLFLMTCDVSKREQVDDFFAFALEKLGTIDLFIANAGFAYYEEIAGPDWDHNSAIFDADVLSPIYCAEKMKALRGQEPYNFVVTASAMGLLSIPGYALYSGAKAALRGFADAYRSELGPGQHFQVVYPIATRTQFFNRAGGETTPVPWPAQSAEAVARKVLQGIRKDRNHIHPSAVFSATMAANRVLPFILPAYAGYYDRVFRGWRREVGGAVENPDWSPNIPRVPAPWRLRGSGYIILYKFSRRFVEEQGNVPPFLRDSFAGGIGSVMVVNYTESDAGPYGELLFIPGKFRYKGRRLDTISKIYVSTMASVANGRQNWGIPKEQADFTFRKLKTGEEKIRVKLNGRSAAEFTLVPGKLRFPVSTRLLPFPLVQRHRGQDLYTDFSGTGTGSFAKLKDVKINPNLFPDISGCRPLAVIRVDPFRITFPRARRGE